jgi:hypothetical protein
MRSSQGSLACPSVPRKEPRSATGDQQWAALLTVFGAECVRASVESCWWSLVSAAALCATLTFLRWSGKTGLPWIAAEAEEQMRPKVPQKLYEAIYADGGSKVGGRE